MRRQGGMHADEGSPLRVERAGVALTGACTAPRSRTRVDDQAIQQEPDFGGAVQEIVGAGRGLAPDAHRQPVVRRGGEDRLVVDVITDEERAGGATLTYQLEHRRTFVRQPGGYDV